MYLNLLHAVPGVESSQAQQGSPDVVEGGVPGQVQTLLLLRVAHHTPGDCRGPEGENNTAGASVIKVSLH